MKQCSCTSEAPHDHDFEDPRSRPRNVDRLLVRVETDRRNIGLAGHHLLEPGEHFIVIYVDERRELDGRLQTEAHHDALRQATRLCEARRAKFFKEEMRGVDQRDAEAVMRRLEDECSIHPYQFLADFGVKTGIPPLVAWETIRSYPRPETPTNQAIAAQQALTRAFSDAMQMLKAPQAPAAPAAPAASQSAESELDEAARAARGLDRH